ncbi:DNA polymerase family B domain-containing protein [Penicillium canescens]|nr:DNA polymerase family B domain-containing protein [Penicillium canescens]
MLSVILDQLIQMRMDAKTDKNSELASCIKTLVCSFYGMLGSRHGAMSSKTCAEITTHLARYYLKKIVRVTQSCGYRVRYGGMGSIFCEVMGGLQIKKRIYEEMRGTVFESIGVDIKGNYMSILIPSKKKYEAVSWDGEVETKELASVKKDTLPIVKFVVSKVLTVINSPMTKENKTESHEGGRVDAGEEVDVYVYEVHKAMAGPAARISTALLIRGYVLLEEQTSATKSQPDSTPHPRSPPAGCKDSGSARGSYPSSPARLCTPPRSSRTPDQDS